MIKKEKRFIVCYKELKKFVSLIDSAEKPLELRRLIRVVSC